MNGSFNAYLLPTKPRLRRFRQHVTMTRKMILEDDIKEYWGFYLLRGSQVRLSTCARYVGSSFIIVKGNIYFILLSNNNFYYENILNKIVIINQCIFVSIGLKDARRCSYLGELDSNEEESDEISNEFEFEHAMQAIPHSFSTSTPNKISQNPKIISGIMEQNRNVDKYRQELKDETNKDVDNFFNAFNGMNADSRHIILQKLGISWNQIKSLKAENENSKSIFDAEKLLNFTAFQSSTKSRPTDLEQVSMSKAFGKESETLQMSNNEPNQDNGGEIFDEETNDGDILNDIYANDDSSNPSDIYDIMERGNFNQNNKRDGSKEKNPEEKSSWSSSEEALMKCEGLIAFQQLNGSKSCTANDSMFSEIIYEQTIEESGFYYFIFANENEIRPNFMRVRFDLHKTVFDVSDAKDNCTNTGAYEKCLLPLNFWSEDHVVLEVPENQPDDEVSNLSSSKENSTEASIDPCQEESLIKGFSSHTDCHRLIVAESICTPRKPIYMLFVLLVPILILCFAYI